MRNKFLMTATLVVAAMSFLVFVACDDEGDDNFSHAIVGEWRSNNAQMPIELDFESDKEGEAVLEMQGVENGAEFRYTIDDAKKQLTVTLKTLIVADVDMPFTDAIAEKFNLEKAYTVGFELDVDTLTFPDAGISFPIGENSFDLLNGTFIRQK